MHENIFSFIAMDILSQNKGDAAITESHLDYYKTKYTLKALDDFGPKCLLIFFPQKNLVDLFL